MTQVVVCVCVFVCVCMYMCVCAHARVCVGTHMSVVNVNGFIFDKVMHNTIY